MHFLPKKHCSCPQKKHFFPQIFQKLCKSQQMLISRQIAHVSALNFRPSPAFSAKALRAFAQLLPPWFILKYIFGNIVYIL